MASGENKAEAGVPVAGTARHVTAIARRAARRAGAAAIQAAGGRARARIVLPLAAVVGLNGADTAAISAAAGNLERSFGFGNTSLGMLVSVVALATAVFTLPAGILADRTRRTRLLAVSIVLWSAAMLACGAATSFAGLVAARAFLGVGLAAAGPVVASLTGDFFPAQERGRIYGLILAGDLAGSGIGFLVSGDIASMLSWRYAFWWLALPGAALAWAVWKLPEPARGSQRQLQFQADQSRRGLAARAVSSAGIQPDAGLVLRTDPARWRIWRAVRYVLRVRTNVVIIVGSALGYFYLNGLRSFAIIFATRQYGLSQVTADALLLVLGAGALAGVFAGGRLSDRMLRRGNVRARVLIPAVCLLAITPILAGAIASTSIVIALPLLVLGAALLGAPNPPMDAARLDVMHPRLWGRAEGVRTVLRTLAEAAAPALFGYVSQYVFGGQGSAGATGGTGGTGGPASAAGLEYTFLIFLVLLLAAGLLVLPALRTYPRDVATASASAEAISAPGDARIRPDEPGG